MSGAFTWLNWKSDVKINGNARVGTSLKPFWLTESTISSSFAFTSSPAVSDNNEEAFSGPPQITSVASEEAES